MQTKKLVNLFIFMVVPMVTFFAASEAMAFSDEPCYGVNYTGSGCSPPSAPDVILEGEWQIKLVNVTPINNTGKYDWHYTLRNNYGAGNATGLNFFALLIPDCCTAPGVDVWVKNINSIWNDPLGIATGFKERFNVAAGEPTLKFGLYIENGYVVKGTPDASSDWHLIASTDQMTRSSGVIKTNSGAYSFEMVVPGCTPPLPLTQAPPISTYAECINFGLDTANTNDDFSFLITRKGDAKGCIQSLQLCNGLGCSEANCQPAEEEDLPPDYVFRGSFHPATCPDEDLQATKGSPIWVDTVSGGVRWVGCYSTNRRAWCELNCCKPTIYPSPVCSVTPP